MWIWQNPDWPHLVWDDSSLSPLLAQVRHQQGLLLGRMQGLGFELQQEASLESLTQEVVKSWFIEGEHLPDDEVRSSIARQLGLEAMGKKQSSRQVEQVSEVLLDATRNFDTPVTAERLFQWQAALFQGLPGKPGETPIGHWRTGERGPMRVISGPIGRETVHFEAPPAEHVPAEMQAFLAWFNQEQPHLDPLIKAGMAHLWFVTVHPFADGNGRMGRILLDYSLARSERLAQRYYSLSRQMEQERRDYYKHLEQQQRNGLDITPWLHWFLECLGRALETAQDSTSHILKKADFWRRFQEVPLNPRQRKALQRLLEPDFEGPINSSKYARLCRCSQDTAARDLKQLVEWGMLSQNPGGGRSTSYRVVL